MVCGTKAESFSSQHGWQMTSLTEVTASVVMESHLAIGSGQQLASRELPCSAQLFSQHGRAAKRREAVRSRPFRMPLLQPGPVCALPVQASMRRC